MAQYLSVISNILDLRSEVKWSEHFQIDNKNSDTNIVQNRIEMDFIETEFGTLIKFSLILKFCINAHISVNCPNILDIWTFLGCITMSVITL